MTTKDFAHVDQIKDLEMEKLSWVMQVGPKCNHMYLFKKEAEGSLLIHNREQGYGMETE